MRVLLSTIGSRGEVQPLLALALQLRARGQDVRICAPPDFREWIERFHIPFVAVGPTLRPSSSTGESALPLRPSREQLQQLAIDSVAAQFAAVSEAARGCDVIVAGGGLQIAARSVSEASGIRYVFMCYCPMTLPSPHHAPPTFAMLGDASATDPKEFGALWARDAARFNDTFGAALNRHRATAGLAPVSDVRSHVFTDRPWLAADPTLAPWPGSQDLDVFQTGAWFVNDRVQLADALNAFLARGDPPVYFGFGSMRVPSGVARMAIDAAGALGRRAIVARGWADLAVADTGPDCICIDEVDHSLLFPRVAAVVHHGGAGTTSAAARAGTPQLVVPQMFDQRYWAERVARLGIGSAHAAGTPTRESMIAALRLALAPDVAATARTVAAAVRTDGVEIAAAQLIASA